MILYPFADRNELALYKAATGERVRSLARPNDNYSSAWEFTEFSPDGRVVAGQKSMSSVVWFWNAASGEILGSFRIPPTTGTWKVHQAIRFSPDSKRIAVAMDRIVHIVDRRHADRGPRAAWTRVLGGRPEIFSGRLAAPHRLGGQDRRSMGCRGWAIARGLPRPRGSGESAGIFSGWQTGRDRVRVGDVRPRVAGGCPPRVRETQAARADCGGASALRSGSGCEQEIGGGRCGCGERCQDNREVQ